MHDKDFTVQIADENSIISSIQSLCDQYKIFLEDVASTHKRFYEILAGIYHIVLRCDGDHSAISAIDQALKSANIKCKSGSTLSIRIVKLVFCSERRHASNYASVLSHALLEGITGDKFVDWVSENGGVEAIRLKKTPVSKRSVGKKTSIQSSVKKNITSMKAKAEIAYRPESIECETPFLLLAYINNEGKTVIVGRFSDKVAESRINHKCDASDFSNKPGISPETAEGVHPRIEEEPSKYNCVQYKQYKYQKFHEMSELIKAGAKAVSPNNS